jgi:hypothetical protein
VENVLQKLLDQAPTEAMKNRIAKVSMSEFPEGDLELAFEVSLHKFEDRVDRQLIKMFKQCAIVAEKRGNREIADQCLACVSIIKKWINDPNTNEWLKLYRKLCGDEIYKVGTGSAQ